MLQKFFSSLPVQLLLLSAVIILWGHHFPDVLSQGLYALSISLKELLVFVLPFVIFSYIFSCLCSFKGNVGVFFGSLLLAVCFSNCLSTMIAYGVGHLFLSHEPYGLSQAASSVTKSLLPLWNFSLPKLIPTDLVLLSGAVMGFFGAVSKSAKLILWSGIMKNKADFLINRLFVPLLPLFVVGFVMKMQYDGVLVKAFMDYGKIVSLFSVTLLIYVVFLLGMGRGFYIKRWMESLRNIFPAAVTGFSAMSSLAALPLSLQAAKANTDQDPLVDAVVPTVVNIHLVGDSIAIPMMALALMQSFGLGFPSFEVYCLFSLYFVMNKFAVAAVPGGGILVMLPVLSQYLHFNDEMLSLIMMLYILFDSLITTSNVVGNGAFVVIFTKLFRKCEKIYAA